MSISSLDNCAVDFNRLLLSFKKSAKVQVPFFIRKIEFILSNYSYSNIAPLEHDSETAHFFATLSERYIPDYFKYRYSLREGFFEFLEVCLQILEDYGDDTPKTFLDSIARGFLATPILEQFTPHAYINSPRRILEETLFEKGFFFVHFTNLLAKTQILKDSFVGVTDVLDLSNTGKGLITGDYELNRGFIFAYLLQAQSREDVLEEYAELCRENKVVCRHAHAIVGFATNGLLVYHKGDKELQLIVPSACIDRDSLFPL